MEVLLNTEKEVLAEVTNYFHREVRGKNYEDLKTFLDNETTRSNKKQYCFGKINKRN